MIRALAKGARRPKAPYSGGIELLSRGYVGLILRPSAGLHLLTEWDLVETFPGLRRDLHAYHVACYMADLCQHLVSDHDPHRELYDELLAGLRATSDADAAGRSLLRFQWAALVHGGYRPVLEPSTERVTQASETDVAFFNPALGGFVSPDAQETGPARTAPRAWWRVRASTAALLASVARGDETTAAAARSESVARANALLACYVRYLLGREPATFPLLFPMLAGNPLSGGGDG